MRDPTTRHRFLANPQTHKCPTRTGEWGLLDTHPTTHPPTTSKLPYHRQNALTSAFGADPKSPTTAYPTGGWGGEGGGWKPTHPEILTTAPPPPVWVGRTDTKKNPGPCGLWSGRLDLRGTATPPPKKHSTGRKGVWWGGWPTPLPLPGPIHPTHSLAQIRHICPGENEIHSIRCHSEAGTRTAVGHYPRPPPPCHSRRFKGKRPIGAATGQQSQPPRPCANPPPPLWPRWGAGDRGHTMKMWEWVCGLVIRSLVVLFFGGVPGGGWRGPGRGGTGSTLPSPTWGCGAATKKGLRADAPNAACRLGPQAEQNGGTSEDCSVQWSHKCGQNVVHGPPANAPQVIPP